MYKEQSRSLRSRREAHPSRCVCPDSQRIPSELFILTRYSKNIPKREDGGSRIGGEKRKVNRIFMMGLKQAYHCVHLPFLMRRQCIVCEGKSADQSQVGWGGGGLIDELGIDETVSCSELDGHYAVADARLQALTHLHEHVVGQLSALLSCPKIQ
jgi:hypothetical protein